MMVQDSIKPSFLVFYEVNPRLVPIDCKSSSNLLANHIILPGPVSLSSTTCVTGVMICSGTTTFTVSVGEHFYIL